MSTIIFATTNQGKVASLRRALDEVGLVDVAIDARSLDVIEPQADTCEEVAVSKARQAYKLLSQPVLVDDSSFHISTLGGFPGVYAKYMNETLGAKGIVDFMKGKADRSAHFDGVLVYVDAAGEQHVFRQKPYKGHITTEVRTMDDTVAWSELHKIFVPEGSNKVLGEMSVADVATQGNQEVSKYILFARWLAEQAA